MPAHAMMQSNAYNGMMVLDHTVNENGCKFVEVSCVPTTVRYIFMNNTCENFIKKRFRKPIYDLFLTKLIAND